MGISSREWSAIDRPTDIVGSARELVVNGTVDVPSTAHSATLTKAVPQGINGAILILHLKIEQSGIGADVITPRNVEYQEQPIDEEQYSHVDIQSDGASVEMIEVSIAHS
jgi:hypothetical protein